jgi:hypothetical protein
MGCGCHKNNNKSRTIHLNINKSSFSIHTLSSEEIEKRSKTCKKCLHYLNKKCRRVNKKLSLYINNAFFSCPINKF